MCSDPLVDFMCSFLVLPDPQLSSSSPASENLANAPLPKATRAALGHRLRALTPLFLREPQKVCLFFSLKCYMPLYILHMHGNHPWWFWASSPWLFQPVLVTYTP